MKSLSLIVIFLVLSCYARQDSVEELLKKIMNNNQVEEEITQLSDVLENMSQEKKQLRKSEKIADSANKSIFFPIVNKKQYNYTNTSYPSSSINYTEQPQNQTLNNNISSNPSQQNYSYPYYNASVNYYSNTSYPINSTNYTNYTNSSYPQQYNYSYPQYNTSVNYYSNTSYPINSTNYTNYTNSSYPQQYNYSYPLYNTSANYYSNTSYPINSTNYTNYTNSSYPQQYNYSYPQYNTSANYYSNTSYPINSTNYTNYTNSSYPQQYNYSYPQYNTSANYYSNTSYPINSTNYTNYTNSSYPQQYNYSYPQYNTSANYYSNTSYPINSTNYTNYSNSSYPQQYNYSYPQLNQSTNYYSQNNLSNTSNNSNLSSTARQRLQQSKISLKLRNQDIVQILINQTQSVLFYNQSMQQYQQIVIFNQTDLYRPQFQNDNEDVWYYYQDNELITLTKVKDSKGNTIYRNATLQFNLYVAEYPVVNYAPSGEKNIIFYGTLVYSQAGVQTNYQYQNNQNIQEGDQYFGNYTSQNKEKDSKGQLNLQNGQINSQVNRSSSTNDYESERNYLDSNNESERFFYSNSSSSQNQETINKRFDINTHQSNSNKVQNSTSSYSSHQYEQINQNGIINSETIDLSSDQRQETISTQQKSNDSYTSAVQSNQDNVFQTHQINEYQNGTQTQDLESLNQQAYHNTMNSTTQNNGGQGSFQSQTSNTANTTHLDINKTSNSTQNQNIYNLTSNNIVNTRQIDQQTQDGQVNQQVNSSTVNIFNQTNVDSVLNSIGNQTTINSQQTEIDRQYSQQGDNLPETSTQSSSSSYSNQIDPTQQLNQLRGSKRQVSGAWNKLDENKFSNSNSLVIDEAINAVNTKFNPQKEGFQFDQIISVHEQLVAGFNYNIKLSYLNQLSEQQIYEVIIYSIPWANKPDQITSCIRFDQKQE